MLRIVPSDATPDMHRAAFVREHQGYAAVWLAMCSAAPPSAEMMAMVPEDVVEKVAQAIAPAAWSGQDTLAQRNRRTASLRHARAAIAALCEAMAK